MARKKYYLPLEDAKLALWLQNLSTKIAAYAAKYGITAAEVALIQQAATYFAFWLNALNQLNAAVQNLTGFKNEIRDGVKAGGSPSVTPTDILFGVPPAAVPHGILAAIRSIVGRIKKHQSYTTADGEQLQIEGDEQVIDPSTLKPVFKIELEQGHPNLIWKKGIATAVKIKVYRGNGSPTPPTPGNPTPPGIVFEFLAIDTQPDYLDTYPLPNFGDSATWVYTMIYMIGDEEVGEWSEIVQVTVSGTP